MVVMLVVVGAVIILLILLLLLSPKFWNEGKTSYERYKKSIFSKLLVYGANQTFVISIPNPSKQASDISFPAVLTLTIPCNETIFLIYVQMLVL